LLKKQKACVKLQPNLSGEELGLHGEECGIGDTFKVQVIKTLYLNKK
jgi:hypothetical protein